MNSRHARAVALALLLAGAGQMAGAEPAKSVAEKAVAGETAKSAPHQDPALAADPAVRSGTLPNGLRYSVMQNRTPGAAISVRLVFKVGSYDEQDDERGYAHFLEHMAFRSTRFAPEGVLDGRFASLGVAIGKDQNAFTNIGSTLYTVDLPTDGLDGLKQVLDWLRSGAGDMLLTPAAVDAERGVVLAELQTRNGPLAEAQRAVMRFQAAGLRSSDREPGGTEAALRAATPARLQAFYDRWYRPENATLVVVGSPPAETLQRLVEQSFSDWQGRGEAGKRVAAPTALPARGLDALALSNSAMPAAVSSCRLGVRREVKDPAARNRRDSLTRLWTGILGERLQHAASAAGSPLLGALALSNHDMPDAEGTCLVAVPVAGKWKEALGVAQAELRRFAKDGPSAAEVKKEIDDLQGPLNGAVTLQAGRKTADLATAIAAAALDDRVFQAPDQALAASETAVKDVTPADVRKAFEEDWSGAGPLLTVIAPEAPPRDSVLAAWRENETAAPLAAYADRAAAVWAYQFGKPGKVARREQVARPDFVRLRFRNGVILNFRHSELEPGDAEIRVRFGNGASGIAPAERGPAIIGAGLFPSGGLGKLDFEQIGSAYAQTSWRFELGIPTSSFLLTSSPIADQVSGELELLAAYMTDPGFRPTIDEKLPTAVDFAYRYLRTEPSAVATDAFEQKLFPGQGTLPPREEMDRWHARDFERLLKPALVNSPIEVTIVGDLSEKEAIAAVAGSFGALPKRAAPASPPAYPFRRFPEQLPATISTYHQGPGDKAAAILVWPLYVASPERRKEEYALSLVASIFQNRLVQQVRVKMGKVYSPAVATSMPDDADQGFLAAALESAPADVDRLVAATRDIARELASGAISQEELDKARQPMVAARSQAQTRNAAWASIVSQSAHDPAAVDELLSYSATMASITLDDVRAAAATWLTRDALVSMALPAPQAAAAGAAGKAR